MRKLGKRHSYALFVAGMATLVAGVLGCDDSLIQPPVGNAGATAPAPISGSGLTGTGVSGVTGISGTAPMSGGVGGTPVVAGSAAPAGGTPGSGPLAGAAGAARAGAAAGAGGAAGASTGGLPPFDGGDASLNAVQPGAVCSRFAALDCAGETHCCNNPGQTVAQCEAAIMSTCTDTFHFDDLSKNPVTGFDTATAQMAFTVLEQKVSQCDPNVAAWILAGDGLRSMFKGTVAPGKNCKPTQNLTDKATEGAALASCTGISTTACLPQSALGNWTCAPLSAVGGPCVTDINCTEGAFCRVQPPNLLGKCTTRLAVGAACTALNQCASLFCKNSVCVAADQQVAYCLKTN